MGMVSKQLVLMRRLQRRNFHCMLDWIILWYPAAFLWIQLLRRTWIWGGFFLSHVTVEGLTSWFVSMPRIQIQYPITTMRTCMYYARTRCGLPWMFHVCFRPATSPPFPNRCIWKPAKAVGWQLECPFVLQVATMFSDSVTLPSSWLKTDSVRSTTGPPWYFFYWGRTIFGPTISALSQDVIYTL